MQEESIYKEPYTLDEITKYCIESKTKLELYNHFFDSAKKDYATIKQRRDYVMNYNDKLIIELIKQLVISSNCPFWYKQNIIREIDNFTYFKDIMNPNDYYNNLIWYIVKEIFNSSGIIPNYLT